MSQKALINNINCENLSCWTYVNSVRNNFWNLSDRFLNQSVRSNFRQSLSDELALFRTLIKQLNVWFFRLKMQMPHTFLLWFRWGFIRMLTGSFLFGCHFYLGLLNFPIQLFWLLKTNKKDWLYYWYRKHLNRNCFTTAKFKSLRANKLCNT